MKSIYLTKGGETINGSVTQYDPLRARFTISKTATVGLYDLSIDETSPAQTRSLANAFRIVENTAGISAQSSAFGSVIRSLSISPSPASNTIDIRFELAKHADVQLRLFDVDGREVANMLTGESEAGLHGFKWNVQDLPSGVYHYMLTGGSESLSGKLVIQH